jgi:hypothetical protein
MQKHMTAVLVEVAGGSRHHDHADIRLPERRSPEL